MKYITILILLFLSPPKGMGEEYWLAFTQQTFSPNRGYYVQLISEYPQEVIIENPKRSFIDTVCTPAIYRIPDLIAKPDPGNPISPHGIKITSEEPLQVLMINYDHLQGGMTVVRERQYLGSEYIILSETANNADHISIVCITKTELFVYPSINTNISTQPFTVVLDPGEVLHFQVYAWTTDGLSGTVIIANSTHTGSTVPVAVFVNSQFITNPHNNCCADDLDHQEIPTKFWGKEYFVPHIIAKSGNLIQQRYSDIKILSKEDNTQVIVNGQQVILNALQIYQYPSNNNNLITSSKPIRVILVSRGGDIDFTNSDPFSINIFPTKYSKEKTFIQALRSSNIQDHYLIVTHKLCNEFTLNNTPQTHIPYNDSLCAHYYVIDTNMHTLEGQVQAYQYSFGNRINNYDAYGTELFTEEDSTACAQNTTGIQSLEVKDSTTPSKYNLLGQEAKKYRIK